MITPDDKLEIQSLIEEQSRKEFGKRIGDTPTEALQLVNKKYVDGKTFGGIVDASGNPQTPFPIGWTSTKTATGEYTVTHNLNRLTYTVVVTPSGSSAGTDNVAWTIPTQNLNTFTVSFVQSNVPATSINTNFNFILVL